MSRLPIIASTLYQDASPIRRLKKSAVFCFNALKQKRDFQTIQQLFDCPKLNGVLKVFPAILDKPFDPYVCADWEFDRRATELKSHFMLVRTLFGENAVKMYQPECYPLYSFTTKDAQLFTVELFPGYQNEGSLGIKLCDAERREVYTLSFHLSALDTPICYIGALQGPNDSVPNRHETIVSITRSLNGLRPKALMIETLYMVLRSINISEIYGVSNAGHIYQSAQFGNKQQSKVEFDFDKLWLEFFATQHSDTLFKLPKSLQRKELSDIKPKKRSLYRKRYEWLEQTSQQVTAAIDELKVQAVQSDSANEAA